MDSIRVVLISFVYFCDSSDIEKIKYIDQQLMFNCWSVYLIFFSYFNDALLTICTPTLPKHVEFDIKIMPCFVQTYTCFYEINKSKIC